MPTTLYRSATLQLLIVSLLLLAARGVMSQDNAADDLADASVLSREDNDGVAWPGWVDLSEKGMSAEEESFFISLLLIIVSEIGDKTFLIAAIMAMKHSRMVVFSAALSSLVIMSVLSAFLGHVVPNMIPKQYTDILAAVLFLCFGLRMIYEGYHMTEDHSHGEMVEVEEELKEAEDRERTKGLEELEVGGAQAVQARPRDSLEKAKEGFMNLFQLVFSPVFVQTFILTFLGEWGDRSQISTIALAAANNVYWVTGGVVLGHTMCTGLAVMGGRMLAAKISVRTVTLVGAVLFLIFGVIYGCNAYQSQLK